MHPRRAQGFTLLEVMIALAVFALVAASLVRNAAVSVNQAAILEERAMGIWLAENQLNQMRLAPRIDENYPRPGTRRVNVSMAQRDWELAVSVQATENDDIRRVEVRAYRPDQTDQPVAELTGFVGRY